MKTFRQWFDNLSPETQEYLEKECLWIDKESKDRYRHPKDNLNAVLGSTIQYFKSCLEGDKYMDSDNVFLAAAIILRQNKEQFDEKDYQVLLTAFCKEGRDRDILPHIDAFELREIYKADHESRVKLNASRDVWNRRSDKYSLDKKLLVIEDFDQIDWSDTDIGSSYLDDKMIEILGHDKVIELAKENVRCIDFRNKSSKNNSVFDELFFCENGWTPKQKYEVIQQYRYNEDGVRDFIERIVAVDESYLKYVGTEFIATVPALGMHLYKEKKDIEELNSLPAGHNVASEYRYPKEYRKLFQIAACCARGNVGKAMAGTIGDASCILKMYGYNFSQIFDCLYPQYAETATSEETTDANAV